MLLFFTCTFHGSHGCGSFLYTVRQHFHIFQSETQVKTLRQIPGKVVAVFYCKLRKFTDKAVCNILPLITFTENFAILVVYGELREDKQTVVEDPISLAPESYLNFLDQHPDSSMASADNLAGPSTSQSGIFFGLLFTTTHES